MGLKTMGTYKTHALFVAALLAAVQDGLADGDGVPLEEVVGNLLGFLDLVVVVEPALPATEILSRGDLLLGHR